MGVNRPHNPKVVSSNLTPATNLKVKRLVVSEQRAFFIFTSG